MSSYWMKASVTEKTVANKEVQDRSDVNQKIVWVNVLLYLYLHISSCYAVYLIWTKAYWQTPIFAWLYGTLGCIGVTAGCHRLWTHRAYKAKLPLRIFLSILASIAAENDIFEWCRDHRVHHKFTDTTADPHNVKQGFFFAQYFWLIFRKHPDVIAKGKTVFLGDLWADPVIRFQRRFFLPMAFLFCIYLPTMIPVWFWGETLLNSFIIAALARYLFSQHFIGFINSIGHTFGDRPFDKNIRATENRFVAFFSCGEGWHNYHHVFPSDYSASELGYTLNLTKLFIDIMAMLGLAYDLKSINLQSIKSKKCKSGDGTRIKGS